MWQADYGFVAQCDYVRTVVLSGLLQGRRAVLLTIDCHINRLCQLCYVGLLFDNDRQHS